MTEADWTVLDIEGMEQTIRNAARKVAQEYGCMEEEDLAQEGFIRVATRADEVLKALDERGLDRVHHWVWCDLTDLARVEAGRRNRSVSYEVVMSERE